MENKKNTVDNVRALNFASHASEDGWLLPIELNSLPFKAQRLFFVSGVFTKKPRGCHSHYTTQQILICVRGECTVICKDGTQQKSFLLNDPSCGILIPEMIWDEQVYHTHDTILAVIASTKYDCTDYIEDWQTFLKEVGNGT